MAAGTRLGVYEALEPTGAGGMGEVYRARDTKLQRDVALKSLSSSSVSVRVFLLPFLSLWSVTQIFTSWNPLMNWMRSVDLVRRVA